MTVFGIDVFSATTVMQLVLLALSFVLAALIGLERQRRLKSAGIRTHTLVGIGAAVFTLVSAYGFRNVIGHEIILDPSRIAAQIVSGIGFLGAGVIFVRRNAVSGLTTAASIWVTAAIGMACGAGLPVVAAAATLLYFASVLALARLGSFARPDTRDQVCALQYADGRGVLREVLHTATALGFDTALESTRSVAVEGEQSRIEARIAFRGQMPKDELIQQLASLDGVTGVRLFDADED